LNDAYLEAAPRDYHIIGQVEAVTAEDGLDRRADRLAHGVAQVLLSGAGNFSDSFYTAVVNSFRKMLRRMRLERTAFLLDDGQIILCGYGGNILHLFQSESELIVASLDSERSVGLILVQVADVTHIFVNLISLS
jgi:hypothetical protein